ncbi:TonB-dependent receptor [Pseudoalteromonas luteoviolacea]|uniref:TonB-dependent receptor plug domain-containing protein n=1 Tax=Pseudoalteromonas luteoviolacea TaxID=43657 RepID=UPI001B3A03D5|nr:TonB-dependent receptor [Pseudoalteromonas luteoviolacea]MBQ4877460.1 TonB-dependent receptor [Pseudoalteromonas luteoviolacea]MBQ4906441.1 TonB-dependent receptor [Pseudoalteromonas luteoviolacea]
MLNTKVTKAVRIALAFGAASSAAFAANAVAAEGAEKVERIEVTGSRIKRVDMEGASPVEVISTAEFESQGRVSVAEALQSVTSNSFGSIAPASGNSAQSQNTVSLLGAGAGRTLVLVDGKRLGGSPSLNAGGANLSSIPMAAVERIEILKDGASAIYGSDAIAGVINVILKKDFEGAAFDIQVGRPEADGGETKQMSLSFGVSSDKGNITFVYDHQERRAIFDRDRDYTKATMEDKNGDGVISAGDETTGISIYGATIRDEDGNHHASLKCNELTKNVPGFVGVLDQGTGNGGIGNGEVCGYAFADVSANMASTKRDSIMTSLAYELTDDIELYARGMFSRNDSFGRYAPAAAMWRDMPADNEHNPLNVEADGLFRWYQLGNRDGEVTDYQQDYLLGLKGMFGDTAEWEVSYHKARLDYRTAGRYYLSYSGLAYNNLYDIDMGSEEGINNMRATTYVESQSDLDHFFAGLGFEFGELEGGMISHYVGGEYFEEVLDSKFDAQSDAGLVGGNAGASGLGERDVTALFYEVAFPILDNLIVSAAYRYDDYSDFGSVGNPSVKLEYRPFDDLLVRGSYSEGFRAPTLKELYGADSEGSPATTDYVACKNALPAGASEAQIRDAYLNCPQSAYYELRKSNENLGAEESTYINLGVVYSGFEDVAIKVDYFELEIDNVISLITIQDLVHIENGNKLNEVYAKFPEVKLNRADNGAISGYSHTQYANGSFMSRKGFDIDLSYKLDTSFGEFKFKKVTTVLTEVGEDVYFSGPTSDQKGAPQQPEWRSQFTVNFSADSYAVNWTTDVIAGTHESDVVQVDSTGNPYVVYSGDVPTYVTHNLNVKYFTESYGTFTVGARNLFDKGVLFDSKDKWINDSMYNSGHIGREIFAGYSISF